MISKITRLVLKRKPFYGFNTQKQKAKPQSSVAEGKDLDRSLENFSKSLRLEQKKISQPQNKPINRIIDPQKDQSEVQQTPNALLQKLASQTQSLKEKILAGRTKEFNEVSEHFASMSRPASVYMINELERKNIRNKKEIAELSELMGSEESQDHVSPHPEWVQEQNEVWDYNMDRINQALIAKEHGFTYLPKERSKYRNIAEWRKWNSVFEPFSKQPNEAFPYVPYPGSEKGMLPTDDPENYLNWFRRTYPQEVVQGLDQIAQISRGGKESEEDKITKQEHIASEVYTYANEALQPCTNIELLDSEVEDRLCEAQGPTILRSQKDADEIEPVPEFLPIDPDQLFDEMERWTKFRSIQSAVKLTQFMEKYKEDSKNESGSEIENSLTSLYPYYSTLPEFVRNNPQVKTAYKALEFEKPTLSISQKEQALNFICLSALELDELSEKALTHLADTRRYYPTLEDEKKMIHDIDTAPFDGVLTHLENEDYQDRKPLYPPLISPPGEMPYPFPERMRYEADDLTPVDYYQNDDGFWDDYIKNKYNSYYKNHRFAPRKYFKH